MSRHDDIRIGGCEAGADFDGHHRQLHEKDGPWLRRPSLWEQLIKITGVTETAVYFSPDFSPDDKFQNMSQSGMGAIDRVTKGGVL